MLFSFAENCNNGFERNRISYTDTYTVTGQDLNKHHGMDFIHVSYYIIFQFFYAISASYIDSIYIQGFKDLVTPRMRNNPSGQSDLIVFCSGGFKDLHPAKTEGWDRTSYIVLPLSTIQLKVNFVLMSLQESCFLT